MKKQYPDYKREKVIFDESGKKISKLTKKSLSFSIDEKEKNILKDFRDYCLTTAREKTVAKDLRLLFQIRDVIEVPLYKIDEKILTQFSSLLNSSGKEEWTKNGIRIIIKKFIRWHYQDWSKRFRNLNKILSNKSIKINNKKIRSDLLLTESDIEKLLRAIDNLRDKALFMVMYECGARPHELRLMRWSQINLKKVPAEITLITNKGNKNSSRTLPLNQSVVHLERWRNEYCYSDLKQDDYVFPGKKGRQYPLSINALNWIFVTAGKKAKLEKPIFPYLLRHTRLTELRKLGVQESVAASFGGHTTKTGEIYTHLSGEDINSEILNKVYNIKEPSPEQKIKWEQELDEERKARLDLEERFNTFMKAYDEMWQANLRDEDVQQLLKESEQEADKTKSAGRKKHDNRNK